MSYSLIEQAFEEQCKTIHKDINPDVFIQRYNRYSKEYLPMIEDIMTNMHQTLHDKFPNMQFSLKGRIKSKRSFLIKSLITLSNSIISLFPTGDFDPLKHDDSIYNYFKFLQKDDPARYEYFKNLINKVSPLGPLEAFPIVFEKLSKDEQDKLVYRLGRTEDTFAYRFVNHSIKFPIDGIVPLGNGKFGISYDSKTYPINGSITINPTKDIKLNIYDSKYIIVDGKEELLNERNFLYPETLNASERNLENLIKYSKEHSDGNLTFLRDSFVYKDIFSDHENSVDIKSIEYDKKSDSYFVLTPNDERLNLTQLMNKTDIKLQKSDELALADPVIYDDIYNAIQEFYRDNDIISIPSRYKNYIRQPKPSTNYQSIHDSAVDMLFGLTLEGQLRSLKMEDDAKDESSRIGHDVYKKARSKSQESNPFLAKILAKDKNAFDSSSITLMEILKNPNIDISELLGTYFLTTSLPDGLSYTYKPDIDKIFEHTFSNSIAPSQSSNNLDFSSYRNFMISRKHQKESTLDEEPAYPDFYD